MTRRFRPASTFPRRSPWQRVRGRVTCDYGCAVMVPAWAYFGPFRPDGARLVLCVEHAKQVYKLEPPAPLYGFQGDDVEDVRAKRAGGDE